VEVRVQDGAIWLSQKNIGQLFETTPENVLMHLKNIYAENELSETATAKEFLAVQTEGKRQVQRSILHYHLDAIIAVGYRVNSKRATAFSIADKAHAAAPTARLNSSPGQCPGYPSPKTNPALKGRPNPCHNPSRVSTFTSSSARKTANRSSPTPCVIRFTPTWPRCCKTSVALRC
jgi:hypothetical protein